MTIEEINKQNMQELSLRTLFWIFAWAGIVVFYFLFQPLIPATKEVPNYGETATIKMPDGQVDKLYGHLEIKPNGGHGEFSGLFSSGEVDWTSTGFTINDITPGRESTSVYGPDNNLQYHKLTKEEAKEHGVPTAFDTVADKEQMGKRAMWGVALFFILPIFITIWYWITKKRWGLMGMKSP